MQLPNEVLSKFRQLLDKPISPLTVKQLKGVIVHQSLPKMKVIESLLIKYRGDMIIHLFCQNQIPNKMHDYILKNIISHIMDYEVEDLIKIWRFILIKENQNRKQQIGYQQILKEAVKVTNVERKDRLFHLISENINVIWAEGCKAIIIHISTTYFKLFIKLFIYVPWYVSIVKQLIILHSKHIDQLPIFNQETVVPLVDQIVNILINSVQKPLHSLHRQCLNTLTTIGQNYQQFVYQCLFEVIRCVNIYVLRRSVRDDARKTLKLWKGVIQVAYEQNNRLKMQKVQKNEEKQKQQNKILIENIIQKTNDYRNKFQVGKIQTPSVFYQDRKQFLKKGVGTGGGKAYLQGYQSKLEIAKKANYQYLVEDCLRNSNIKQSPVKVSPKRQRQRQRQRSEQNYKMTKSNAYVQTASNYLQSKPIQSQLRQIQMSESLHPQDQIQIQQISNLIDLAYSYKFSELIEKY